MRRTILTILSTLLITLSAVQTGAASERHAGKRYDRLNFRGAYNSSAPFDAAAQTRALRSIEDTGTGDRVWCSWADCSPPWEHSAHGG